MSAFGGGGVEDFGGVGIGGDPTGAFISSLPSFARALGGGSSSAKSTATSVTDIVFANPFNFGTSGDPVERTVNSVLPIAVLAIGAWAILKLSKR